MGRTGVVARPDGRRLGWRLLPAALATLALLATGLAHALPRVVELSGPGAAAAVAAPAAHATSRQGPHPDLVVRGAPLAVVPAPPGPAAGLLPVGIPPVAPHLLAEPKARPPTARLAAAAPGSSGSRAPPRSTGT